MLSGGNLKKNEEENEATNPLPASKFYPNKQTGSRRIVEEPPYKLERVLNDSDSLSCWAAKNKSCIVYPSWGDLSSRFPTACWVHRTKSQDTKYYPFEVGPDDTTVNQLDEEETSSETNS